MAVYIAQSKFLALKRLFGVPSAMRWRKFLEFLKMIVVIFDVDDTLVASGPAQLKTWQNQVRSLYGDKVGNVWDPLITFILETRRYATLNLILLRLIQIFAPEKLADVVKEDQDLTTEQRLAGIAYFAEFLKVHRHTEKSLKEACRYLESGLIPDCNDKEPEDCAETAQHMANLSLLRAHVDREVSRLRNHEMIEMARAGKIKAAPGAIALLRYLHSLGVRIGYNTSSVRAIAEPMIKAVLGTEVYGFFEASVCGDEVTNRKPDVEGWLKCAAQMGVTDTAKIFIVDDGISVIKAARKAGFGGGILLCDGHPNKCKRDVGTANDKWFILHDLSQIVRHKKLVKKARGR